MHQHTEKRDYALSLLENGGHQRFPRKKNNFLIKSNLKVDWNWIQAHLLRFSITYGL